MFCPKCGTENPEEGKFCRKCGTDISRVSKVIGNDPHTGMDLMGIRWDGDDDVSVYGVGLSTASCHSAFGSETSNDPDELFAGGIRTAIVGFGFLVVACGLLITNVAGGQFWWWAMLIPAFAMMASGIGNITKSRRIERKRKAEVAPQPAAGSRSRGQRTLEEARTEFVPPGSPGHYDTSDLAPPSVVEETTKHLRRDPEAETMTLPDVEARE